jgi:GT2 family glycosyltransferase
VEDPVISVIVPARNAAATIGRTLEALAGQRGAPSHELIVVDSGSSDDTVERVRRDAPRALLLHNPGGEPAGSRNLGVGRARGRWLAFTDADCEPEPDWLASGAGWLGDGFDLVQGSVRPAGPAGPFDRTVSVGSEYGLYETANLFVAREAFELVGGFAPVPGLGIGTGQPFGEDAWFAWRAKRAGARTTFAEDAVVRHAVFPRGPGAWVSERARARYFPGLVALIPELRRTFLRRRLFLTPASLRFDLALAGVAVAVVGPRSAGQAARRTVAVVSVLPYARDVMTDARSHGAQFGLARVLADAVTFAALVQGSVTARSPVL